MLPILRNRVPARDGDRDRLHPRRLQQIEHRRAHSRQVHDELGMAVERGHGDQYLSALCDHRVCGSTRGIEASHTGPHGIGQKSPDTSAIPLCARHHRTGTDSYHRLGPRKFSERHNLDIPAIVRRLNLKPTIRVEEGWFVTYIEDQRYVLGNADAGVRPAIREALQLCRENRVAQKFAS